MHVTMSQAWYLLLVAIGCLIVTAALTRLLLIAAKKLFRKGCRGGLPLKGKMDGQV